MNSQGAWRMAFVYAVGVIGTIRKPSGTSRSCTLGSWHTRRVRPIQHNFRGCLRRGEQGPAAAAGLGLGLGLRLGLGLAVALASAIPGAALAAMVLPTLREPCKSRAGLTHHPPHSFPACMSANKLPSTDSSRNNKGQHRSTPRWICNRSRTWLCTAPRKRQHRQRSVLLFHARILSDWSDGQQSPLPLLLRPPLSPAARLSPLLRPPLPA
mmetsp:Transcript_121369/g.305212  ORF Transcript_121369/g.305212 Transcript_121369/m.305212 type:complete len:211 (+) Transcript_121369:197-829(+)